jgi:hypothetical protein
VLRRAIKFLQGPGIEFGKGVTEAALDEASKGAFNPAEAVPLPRFLGRVAGRLGWNIFGN